MSTELDDRLTQLSLINRFATPSFGGFVIAALAVAFMTGCDPAAQNAGNQTMRGPANDTLLTETPPQRPADTLVDRAQQDVDFFLKQRAATKDSNTNTTPPTLGAQANSLDQSAGRSSNNIEQAKIIWNEPSAIAARDFSPTATNQTTVGGIDSSAATTDLNPIESPTNSAAAQPFDDKTLAPADQLIADLSRALYRDAAGSDAPLRELMLIAATSIIDAEHAPSPTELASLSERDRELLAQMQKFFAELGDQLSTAEDKDQAILASVSQLAQALDHRPPLTISHASLCMRVRGFGDFDEFDKTTFLAQSGQRIIVYIELDNFTSELNEQQQWVTQLAQELVIYSDRDGIPVWSETWQSVVDVTRNKRKDFFTVQLVTLPPALSVGKYYLKVRMRDEKTGSNAEKSIPFEMVADPRMAAKSK